MNNLKFSVTASGDSGSNYKVDVEVRDSKLFLLCGCPAGLNSTRCKHVLSFIDGDFSRVKDDCERSKLSDLFHSLKLHPADGDLMNELELIEMQEKELKDKKKAIKKGLDRLFFQGIPIE